MGLDKTVMKRVARLTVIAAALTLLFFWVVRENWEYSEVQTDPLTSSGLIPLAEQDSAVILQEITGEADELEQIALVPGNAFNKAGEGYIRIACTLPEEKLVSAAREIVEFADRE